MPQTPSTSKVVSETPFDRCCPPFRASWNWARYYYLWQFLDLPETSSIGSILAEGRRVCAMSAEELLAYNEGRGAGPSGRSDPKSNEKHIAAYCFMAAYATTLLGDGFGFPDEANVTFVQDIDGSEVPNSVGCRAARGRREQERWLR